MTTATMVAAKRETLRGTRDTSTRVQRVGQNVCLHAARSTPHRLSVFFLSLSVSLSYTHPHVHSLFLSFSFVLVLALTLTLSLFFCLFYTHRRVDDDDVASRRSLLSLTITRARRTPWSHVRFRDHRDERRCRRRLSRPASRATARPDRLRHAKRHEVEAPRIPRCVPLSTASLRSAPAHRTAPHRTAPCRAVTYRIGLYRTAPHRTAPQFNPARTNHLG